MHKLRSGERGVLGRSDIAMKRRSDAGMAETGKLVKAVDVGGAARAGFFWVRSCVGWVCLALHWVRLGSFFGANHVFDSANAVSWLCSVNFLFVCTGLFPRGG